MNRSAAAKGRLYGRRLHPAYVAACKWFHCGLLDRTRTLRPGFAYRILDPIPQLREVGTFDEVADRRAEQLLDESLRTRRPIQVCWSGGIDSTATLIALMKAAFNESLRARLEVVCSSHSIAEYRRFFSEHIAGKLKSVVIAGPIGAALDDSKLIVTGEHGDQLFGSVKLGPIFEAGDALHPYRKSIFRIINTGFDDPLKTKRLLDMLQPQIDSAPVEITTVYDYIWWVNFSLKWQHVTLRLPVFRGKRFWPTLNALRHFFRVPAFQLWSLTNPDKRVPTEWSKYKEPARSYILSYTGDQEYFASKQKEPSLKHVLVVPEENGSAVGRRVSWCWEGQPRFEYFSRRKGSSTQYRRKT